MSDQQASVFRNPEMLVGLSAVLIGLAALGVSLFEANLMRQEQRAAVLPIVELSQSSDLADTQTNTAVYKFSLHAANVGIGPATVRDFVVLVDGVHQPTWQAAMRAITETDEGLDYVQSWINGRTIPPGGNVAMFEYTGPINLAKIATNPKQPRLRFAACFCSVFAECWRTEFGAAGAIEAADDCVANPDVELFQE
ncbi:MAG: hypothetical protein AAGH76_06510 [Pseudomonadota bacterium]